MNQRKRKGILSTIEWLGNKLPDPITLFVIGAISVLVLSEFVARSGWRILNPVSGEVEVAKSLLSTDGARWVWMNLVSNFTGFAPLGVVLVGMIGIGLAEHSGLVGAMLKGLVQMTPSNLLTPAVIFVGVMSSLALDAGYIVLPPLACAVFASAGRAPLAGLGAVFAGIGAGFSANLFITGLDPLLQSFTNTSAQLLLPDYEVDIRCNYYFMVVSTFLITLVGWGTTRWFVEPRFDEQDIAEQLAAFRTQDTEGKTVDGASGLSSGEIRGLVAAVVALAITSGIILTMVYRSDGSLHGTEELRPGVEVATWVRVLVPILFVSFLIPGLAYGIVAGSISSDRDAAKMMSDTMSSMGSYIVLAFFAAQFVSWFAESNLGTLIALQGVQTLQKMEMPLWMLVVSIVFLTGALNLFIGSASAKWALISTVFVPIFAGVGIRPELTQAAYRVGDSVTNIIAPLNPYIVIVLVFMQRYMPKAGVGSLISLMLPYAVAFSIAWIILLLCWMALGVPLGPGHDSLFIDAIKS